MQQKMYFKITRSATGRPKALYVQVAEKGNSKGRKFFAVPVINPQYDFWDDKTKRFKDGTDTARINNPIIDKICQRCNVLLGNALITTPNAFVEALKTGDNPTPLTLGDFIQQIIDEMRTGINSDNAVLAQRPSKNYQGYINLLHKLERESKLINSPMAEITNAQFKQFSNFVLSLSKEDGKGNYLNLMKLFKQIHTKAVKRELTSTALTFPYADFAPRIDKTKEPALTISAYQRFCELDLSTIAQSGVNADFYKELYYDFCIFLYETKSRPVDVILAHSDNIVTIEGKKYWKYIPEKKKNSKAYNKQVHAPLSDRALQIIDKYKNKSAKGFVFPFALNNYDWDFDNAKSWNKWNVRKTRALEMINIWLKKVGNALKLDFALTLYTFRHSALSHACNANGANILNIALCAGTSVAMLEKHYVTNII